MLFLNNMYILAVVLYVAISKIFSPVLSVNAKRMQKELKGSLE